MDGQPKVWSKLQRQDLRRCCNIVPRLLQQEVECMLGTGHGSVPNEVDLMLLSKQQRKRMRAAVRMAQRVLQQWLDRMNAAQTATVTVACFQAVVSRVSKQSSPAREQQLPMLEHESPAREQQLPVLEQRSPMLEHESPVPEHESPVPEQQSPMTEEQSPVQATNVRTGRQHSYSPTDPLTSVPWLPQHVLPQQQHFAERKLFTMPLQLEHIAQRYHLEIKLLLHGLETEAGVLDVDNELVLARIMLANGAPITQRTYEYLRSELVGWIGNYQHQELGTPIFDSMTYNEVYICIVCENDFAFSCLERCVADIEKSRRLAPFLLVRHPAISDALYCYEAIYMGVNYDEELFCHQVQLHHPKLRADRWIVVGHEVCAEQHKTHFLLLLNEQSALTLTYHHNNNLFICMYAVKFTNCGRVPTAVKEMDSGRTECN